MKMITVDDVIEICHANIAPLSARHQNVAVTALRRVIDSAKEYAVEAVPVKRGRYTETIKRISQFESYYYSLGTDRDEEEDKDFAALKEAVEVLKKMNGDTK